MSPRSVGRVKTGALVGAQEKLDRAREHFHELQAEQLRFQKREPYALRHALRADPDPKLIVVVVDYLAEIDDRFASILGDMIHNLRAALDYIAWEVVKVGTKAPVEGTDNATKISFPVVNGGKHIKSGAWWPADKVFREARFRHLPGIADVHLSIIDRYQPYHRGDLAEDHPLARLARLSNLDKHRSPHVALLFPQSGGFHITSTPPGCLVTGFVSSAALTEGEPLRVGMELGYLQVADAALCNGLEMQPQAEVFIGLENDKGPAMDHLESIEAMLGDLLLEIDAVL